MFILTIALFAVAIVSGGLALRLWKQERDRSRARVASLATAIDGASHDAWSRGLDDFGSENPDWTATSAAPLESGTVGSMFIGERVSAVRGRPLIKAAVGLTMAVGVTVIIAMTGAERDTPAVEVKGPDASLELLSMTHSRDGESFTVTGLVRNSSREPAQGITAVVFAFDHSGSFVTSGRAQLDDLTIGPGDESPFQVVIPKVKDVARYRVSFRTERGIVRHVDRRTAPPIAAGTAARHAPAAVRAAKG